MLKTSEKLSTENWLEGEIKLADSLDRRLIKLINSINQCGSINQAAREVGLSYKGAWNILERAKTLTSTALITSATGGLNGGGTRLTPKGKALLQLFTQIDQDYQLFLQQLNQSLSDDSLAQLLLIPCTLKSNAVNQIFATVIAINPKPESADVVLELIGGERIVALLSFDEIDSLQLEVGRPVLLLISSQKIFIALESDTSHYSASNCLHASIIRVRQMEHSVEITLRMICGDNLIAELNKDISQGLRPGLTVRAVINSSNVIVAARID